MNKKRWVFINIVLVMLLILVVFVGGVSGQGTSSAGENIAEAMTGAVESVTALFEPIFNIVLGEGTKEANSFFAKGLLFILLLGIVYVTLKQVPFFENEGWVLWTTSIVVAVLGIRFITDNILQTILLPYGAVAIAITAAIPFVAWFILINIGLRHERYITIRKVAWIFFAVIFIGLWITRSGSEQLPGSSSLIYPITAFLAFLVIAMDGTLQRFMTRMDIERTQWQTRGKLLRHLS